jgi:2,3-diketo-5-methylthio-1-phosphopentane phosphatase
MPREGFRVFIDFDNTITLGDVLDGVIERFAEGDTWRQLEDEWAAERIGARACLDGQLRTLRATWPEFEQHLDRAALDPGFVALLDVVRRERIELTILSDNFDLFVGHILQRHGLEHVAYRANHLERAGDRVVPSFPFANPDCPGCAHCKKTHFLPPNADQRRVVYIGDGRSDLCPSRHADIVFAKASLLAQLRRENISCIPFDGLADVAAALKKIIHDDKN